MSAIRLGEIPTAFASRFCDRPYSLRNSSFSISPGVTGENSSFIDNLLCGFRLTNLNVPIARHLRLPILIKDVYSIKTTREGSYHAPAVEHYAARGDRPDDGPNREDGR